MLLNFAPFRSEALDLVAEATHLVVNETECALIAEALGAEGEALEAQARCARGALRRDGDRNARKRGRLRR